jgi:pimeloyl-ACP methyl ester carboxylesterase
MLAGTGVPGDQLLLVQNDRISKASGASDQVIHDQHGALRAVMDELMRGGDEAALKLKVRELLKTQIAASASVGPSDAEMDQLMSESMKELGSKWFRFFIAYDPRPALRKVKVPVLALNGEKDTQVDADQNSPEIQKALA